MNSLVYGDARSSRFILLLRTFETGPARGRPPLAQDELGNMSSRLYKFERRRLAGHDHLPELYVRCCPQVLAHNMPDSTKGKCG